MLSRETVVEIKRALSFERMSTYEAAAKANGNNTDLYKKMFLLYAWNAEVSGALLTPIHICEVVVRNAVSNAFECRYGKKWLFLTKLTDRFPIYQKRALGDAIDNNERIPSRIITDLGFAFWQNMFTSRYDDIIWNDYLREVLPNADIGKRKNVQLLREEIYSDLKVIRDIRNRIAHHEPVFDSNKWDLSGCLGKIEKIIFFRSKETAKWMMNNQRALAVINKRPQ